MQEIKHFVYFPLLLKGVGVRGKVLKNFIGLKLFFLAYIIDLKTSLDNFKPQQTQVSMGLEKLHRARRILHIQMQEEKILFLRPEIH